MIVTDFSMEEITGMDILKHAKKRNSKIPVIIMSGFDQNDHEIKNVLAHGAQDILTKPFGKPEEIVSFLMTKLK